MITVLVKYQIQPGMQDAAMREITALVRAVTTLEPACHGISMLRHESDDAQVLLYERWTDKETYVGPHMQTPHIRAFREGASRFLAGPPDISVWRDA